MRTFQELKEVDADAGERGAAVKMGITSRLITRRMVEASLCLTCALPRQTVTRREDTQGVHVNYYDQIEIKNIDGCNLSYPIIKYSTHKHLSNH